MFSITLLLILLYTPMLADKDIEAGSLNETSLCFNDPFFIDKFGGCSYYAKNPLDCGVTDGNNDKDVWEACPCNCNKSSIFGNNE